MNANINDDDYSKVLLICIFNINGKIFTHDIFYKLFSKYGKVLRVKELNKKLIIKIFY